MRTSFVSEISIAQPQADNKPKSFKEDRKSRQNSKQGHTNPLKMKTSFLRQSLSLNTSEQNLSLNLNNPSNTQRNINLVQPNPGLQSDRRQDFMMKKIVQRFSNNASPKNMMYHEHGQHVHETQKERDIIRLSGRKNQQMGAHQIQKPSNQEKQNQKNSVRSFMKHSGIITKNQHQSSSNQQNQEKNHRLSHDSTIQSVVLDNSLADYAMSLNNSFLHNDQVSVLKEQLQLVLKRLAKNQCDIESLKRDKNIDVQLQGVWKQLSLCENKFEMIEKKCSKADDKLLKFTQEIQDVRSQIIKIDQVKLQFQNQVETLENKMLTKVHKLQQRIPNLTQQQQSQRMNEAIKKVKSQMEGMFQIMSAQLQNRIQTNISQLKWDLKSDRIIQSQQFDSSDFYRKKGNKFILSSKKAHQSIALVYKELLKVNKSQSIHSQQSPYFSSDRKKLLQSVLNQSYTRRTVHSSSPVTPQTTNTQSYFRSSNEMQNTSEIEINQVEYFIDPEGYLLDRNQFYILDDKGDQIRLDGSMIELMKKHGLLKC